MKNLKPGQLFTFLLPRKFPFLKKEVALGCVILANENDGIVGVRTYTGIDNEEETPKIEIGFMPIIYSSFKKSLHEILKGESITVQDAWPELNRWREEFSNGNAGAFNDVIWKVENMVWETVQESNQRANSVSHLISVAYPFKNSEGVFTCLKAEAFERNIENG
ncbi:MAG: hypothetical protein GY714_17270 [Desulfobacterales bacterium]|nr:hypothetical protein [Desulfobacterales bacterium]